MAVKKSQIQLLEELIKMVEPISNLSRYYISNINTQIAQKAEAEKTEVTDAEEVKQ